MPIYEYECCDCGCRFERKHGLHDTHKAKCPQCQGKAKRLIQAAPVIYKGSGFYVTDSRKATDTDTGTAKKKD